MRARDAAAELERLAEKYRVLALLAERRRELQATGASGFTAAESRARREAFRALAREFPGALRELDATPIEVLRRRDHAIRELARDLDAEVPLWMELAIAYNAEVREALEIKLWLAKRAPRRDELDTDVHLAFCAWYGRRQQRLRQPESLPLELLARHLWPPQGRIQALVWETLEARFGRPRAEIERLLFGGAR